VGKFIARGPEHDQWAEQASGESSDRWRRRRRTHCRPLCAVVLVAQRDLPRQVDSDKIQRWVITTADFDLELIDSRTLDGNIQELVYRATLHA
jgi:hypothetical protein